MKAFSAVLLMSLALAAYAGEKKMVKTWMMMKSIESCFGEDLLKEYLVMVKTAMAKCAGTPTSNQLDLLNLIPSKVGEAMAQNALLQMASGGHKMSTHHQQVSGTPSIAILSIPSHPRPEDPMMKMMQAMMTMKMMSKMMAMSDRHMKRFKKHPMSGFNAVGDEDYDDDDDNDEDVAAFDDDQMSDMRSIMRLISTAMNRRQKRDEEAYKDVFNLGEKLSEKLAMAKTKFEALVGNYTCVMQEMKVIDADKELTPEKMIPQFDKIQDMWLREQMKENIRLCHLEAESLPTEVLNECSVGPKLGKLKHFMMCEKKRKLRSCMLNDVRKKLEANFGSLEKLVEDASVPERELLSMASYMIHEKMEKSLMMNMYH